jgi:hypothetical protein
VQPYQQQQPYYQPYQHQAYNKYQYNYSGYENVKGNPQKQHQEQQPIKTVAQKIVYRVICPHCKNSFNCI